MDYETLKDDVQDALVVETYKFALEEARRHSDRGVVIEHTMERIHREGDFKDSGLWHTLSIARGAEEWYFLNIMGCDETRELMFQAIVDAIEEAKEEKEEAAFEEAQN